MPAPHIGLSKASFVVAGPPLSLRPMSPSYRITVVVGNAGEPSRTKVLAQALVDALAQRLPIAAELLEIHRLAPAIGPALHPGQLAAEGAQALRSIAEADLVIAASPVYKGSYSGLFKHLFDLLPPEALVGRPVLLAANGGSDRHALVVDHQLRPLFAFFRALTVPSAVYASEADFDGYALRAGPLQQRIEEATEQAAALLRAARRPELRQAA